MQSCLFMFGFAVVVIERDPDSQGEEWSLWLGMVILMDTRLASRQREGAVLGTEGLGGIAGSQGSNENHPSSRSDVSDTREIKKKTERI